MIFKNFWQNKKFLVSILGIVFFVLGFGIFQTSNVNAAVSLIPDVCNDNSL